MKIKSSLINKFVVLKRTDLFCYFCLSKDQLKRARREYVWPIGCPWA